MGDILLIPVTYKEKDYEFEAMVQRYGYIHRVEVNIDGASVMFEPDEENNYRALINTEDASGKSTDAGLLKAIAELLTVTVSG